LFDGEKEYEDLNNDIGSKQKDSSDTFEEIIKKFEEKKKINQIEKKLQMNDSKTPI